MKNVLSLLLPAVLASIAVPVSAQSHSDPSGTYTLQKRDGSPVEPGHVWQVTVVPYLNGWMFSVTRDGDPVHAEGGLLHATGRGTYGWTNWRGTTGTLEEAFGGDHVSTVTSGPNTGTERLWNR
jgi:hypothetical protein